MRVILLICLFAAAAAAQAPPIESGVSHELARWRAAHYSDVRYKLNLTLEKMSPVLKGTIETRVSVSSPHVSKGNTTDTQDQAGGDESPKNKTDRQKNAGQEKESKSANPTT